VAAPRKQRSPERAAQASGAVEKQRGSGPRPDPAPRRGPIERSVSIRELGVAGDLGAQAHYADPEYYSRTYRDRRHDVDYYVQLARRSGGPVLEYGVGNGRVALHIARAGVHLEGIDLSRAMLQDFEERLATEPKAVRSRVQLHHGDMRTLLLGRRFKLAIAPFNAVLHLYDRRDVQGFLSTVREHLEPDGQLVFDFSIPEPADLARDPDREYPAPDLVDSTTGLRVKYSERFEYDPLRQLLLVRMRFSAPDPSPPMEVPLTHRQFFPRELEALLHYNGFEEILFTADFTNQPADRNVDSIVVHCRPVARRGGP